MSDGGGEISPAERAARADPLFRPLTIAEVVKRTGRSRRTIDRWIKDGRLRVIQLSEPPERVVIARDAIKVERATRRAARRGRPPKDGGNTPESSES